MPTYFGIFYGFIVPFIYYHNGDGALYQTGWLIDKVRICGTYQTDLDFEYKLSCYIDYSDKAFRNISLINTKENKFLKTLERLKLTKPITYKELSVLSGNTSKFGAIHTGTALRNNLFPLIIPCHMIVGKKNIGGYLGKTASDSIQLKLKRKLIQLENLRS